VKLAVGGLERMAMQTPVRHRAVEIKNTGYEVKLCHRRRMTRVILWEKFEWMLQKAAVFRVGDG